MNPEVRAFLDQQETRVLVTQLILDMRQRFGMTGYQVGKVLAEWISERAVRGSSRDMKSPG